MLFRIESPDLEHQLQISQSRIATLQWQTENQDFSRELQMRSRVAWQELEAELARYNALLQEKERLLVRSAIAGEVKELQVSLSVGDWLAENELLAVIADPKSAVIEAYVGESDLSRLEVGAQGRFFPDDIYRPAFDVSLLQINRASTPVLEEAYLASTQGGRIAVRQDEQGRLLPDSPIYRVQAVPVSVEQAPEQRLRGLLKLEGERVSIMSRILRSAYAVLIRESGF